MNSGNIIDLLQNWLLLKSFGGKAFELEFVVSEMKYTLEWNPLISHVKCCLLLLDKITYHMYMMAS